MDVDFRSTILTTNPLEEFQLEPDNIGPISAIIEPKLGLKRFSSADMAALASHADFRQISLILQKIFWFLPDSRSETTELINK